jgi:SAM-dependent methyltransferase
VIPRVDNAGPDRDGDLPYVGRELDLFANATNWKSYLGARVHRYLGATVLEIGAGIGTTTRAFCTPSQERWVCVEPDARLASELHESIARGELPRSCEVLIGTIDRVGRETRFDSVIYIDVLEHIEDDRAELVRAANVLRPGGHIIALSPAHQWLYTPFDKSIGHFRRYTKTSMAAIRPSGVELVRLSYLDSAGMLASLANRLALHQSMPTLRQVAVWDRMLVPASRVLDPLLAYSVGKSVLAVWRKPIAAGGAGPSHGTS